MDREPIDLGQYVPKTIYLTELCIMVYNIKQKGEYMRMKIIMMTILLVIMEGVAPRSKGGLGLLTLRGKMLFLDKIEGVVGVDHQHTRSLPCVPGWL